MKARQRGYVLCKRCDKPFETIGKRRVCDSCRKQLRLKK